MEADLPEAAEWFLRHHCVFGDAHADLAALLETVRAEAVPRWTACAEGLPADGIDVLAWREHSGARIAALHDGGWFDEDVFLNNVTHWQPLPPGPNEDETPLPPVP
jgi:hypothetical protein